jgi:hypothetical protein
MGVNGVNSGNRVGRLCLFVLGDGAYPSLRKSFGVSAPHDLHGFFSPFMHSSIEIFLTQIVSGFVFEESSRFVIAVPR